METTHALQILIRGKSTAGPELAKAGAEIANFAKQAGLELLKLGARGKGLGANLTRMALRAAAVGKRLEGIGTKALKAGEKFSAMAVASGDAATALEEAAGQATKASEAKRKVGAEAFQLARKYNKLGSTITATGSLLSDFGLVLGRVGVALKLLGGAFRLLIAPVKLFGALVQRAGKVLMALGRAAANALKWLGKVGLAAAVKTARVAINALQRVLQKLLSTLKLTGIGITGLVVALATLPSVVSAGILKLTAYARELELVRRAMWGIAGEAMPAMLQSLREASAFMVTEQGLIQAYNRAYMLLGKTLADRIPEAFQYLTKVAAATGEDVENLMQRLTRSIGRLSTRWMAYIGTVVTLKEATLHATEMFGKQEDALLRSEIQAAMLDRVLMRLEARTSALPEVVGTAQQLFVKLKTSLRDLWGELGTHFLPAARALLINLNRIVDVVRKLIGEGGALYHPIRKISAAFTALYEILGDVFIKFSDIREKTLTGFGAFADKVISIAWNAIQWGANIVTNLAIGMVRGASIALTAAIEFISNILAYWLAPGSAPRIVSNILDWGAATFTEFLRGFSMAQFDVLEGVQAPLKRALGVLVKLEVLEDKAAAGEMFIGISEALASSIEQFGRTGAAGVEAFEALARVAGGYGESLGELFRRQLDLATAVKILAAAEERLKRAREWEEKSTKRLTKQAREYNKLVRAGADPTILHAKLAEVEASYDSLVAAREEVEVAEEEQKAAQQLVKEKQELVKLQERLLNQLILMGEALADLITDDDDLIEPIEIPEFHIPPIDLEFQELTARIKAMFLKLWADMVADFEESGVMQLVDKLKKTWEESELKVWFEEFILDVREEGLKTALSNLWLKLEGAIQGWLDDKLPWLGDVWRAFTEEGIEDGSGKVDFGAALKALWIVLKKAVVSWLKRINPYRVDTWREYCQKSIDEGTGLINFGAALATLWTKIWDFTKAVVDILVVAFGYWLGYEVADVITKLIKWFVAIFTGENVKKEVEDGGQTLAELFWVGFWSGLIQGFVDKTAEWEAKLRGFFIAGVSAVIAYLQIYSPSGLFASIGKDIVTGLLQGLKIKAGELLMWFAYLPLRLINAVEQSLWRFANLGHRAMDSLRGAIYDKGWEIADAFGWVISKAVNRALNALGIRSRSKVFYEIGRNLTESFTEGIASLAREPSMAMKQMTEFAVAGVTGPGGLGATGARGGVVVNQYFGADSVRTDADIMAIAEATQRALTLRGVRDLVA